MHRSEFHPMSDANQPTKKSARASRQPSKAKLRLAERKRAMWNESLVFPENAVEEWNKDCKKHIDEIMKQIIDLNTMIAAAKAAKGLNNLEGVGMLRLHFAKDLNKRKSYLTKALQAEQFLMLEQQEDDSLEEEE